MSRVRAKDTGPELALRRALWAAGIRRWRCNVCAQSRELPISRGNGGRSRSSLIRHGGTATSPDGNPDDCQKGGT
jgi:hypothetical protein